MPKYAVSMWITETSKYQITFEAKNQAEADRIAEETPFDWDEGEVVDTKGWDYGEIEGPEKLSK